MHFCGNPLHDAPLYAVMAIPFVAPVILWFRHKFLKSTTNRES